MQREGIVRGMTSIQAPSKFVLISPENGRDIDYLYTTSKDLDLRRYKGLRIIVTGEEGLDERWGNTPVIDDSEDPGRGVMAPANLIDGRSHRPATARRTGSSASRP